MAVDLIRKVGVGGNFLAERHTLDYFRKEHFVPELTYRRSHETWLKHSAKNIADRVKERVKTILQKHQPEPLEKDVWKEIEDILKRVDKDLTKTST